MKDEVARIGALREVPAADISDAATHHPLVGGQAGWFDAQLPGNLLYGTLARPLRKLCPRKEGIGMLSAKRDAQANQEGKKHCTEAYRRYHGLVPLPAKEYNAENARPTAKIPLKPHYRSH
jgi:hypothetical protein